MTKTLGNPPESALDRRLPAALEAIAQTHWERFEEACERDSLPPLPAPWPGRLRALFACSDFAARSAERDPARVYQMIEEGLESGRADDFHAATLRALTAGMEDDEAELMLRLRTYRRDAMLRICWRELAGHADCEETLRELTALAEACIGVTLDRIHDWMCAGRHGTPRNADGQAQRLLVLGMGKLGGGELNFSSDIDLIFAFPESGHTDGERPIENAEFFTRLGRRLIKTLNEVTAEGFVFRVDMRLRPFGDSGPLVASLGALESYYVNHGRDWERYAMIKARVIAGDAAAAAEIDDLLRPFVFRRYLDYGAFAALRDMKHRIAAEVERKGLRDNVKLGRGGIREVEFIGQAFQLIRGGRDARLRERGILTILGLLEHAKMLPAGSAAELRAAYLFLRQVENRLQMIDDRQTHELPVEEPTRTRLAWAMGFDAWTGLSDRLEAVRDVVRRHFDEVFSFTTAPPGPERHHLHPLWQGHFSVEKACAELASLGYEDPAAAVDKLTELHKSRLMRALSKIARERLDTLMPALIEAAAQAEDPNEVLSRLLKLIQNIAQRSVYLTLLAEHPEALHQLVRLFASSTWIANYLTQHPILLDELLDSRTLFTLPTRESITQDLAPLSQQWDPDDLEAQMDEMRHFKQVHVLRVATVDLASQLPLMKVSDHLTWLAEAILQMVSDLTWDQLTRRHGRPAAVIDGKACEPGFGILAYGKLGGIELGYGSDLDLVFVHDSQGEHQQTQGAKPVDNQVFFARLGQKIIHFLNARTPAGELYEIDTRLRPNGASGLLVSGIDAFARYQHEQAWTWEHQALVRARMVVGSPELRARFETIRAEVLSRPRDPARLLEEVVNMRERMRKELGSGTRNDDFHLKQDRGGVADIEFMVQYGVLLRAQNHPALLEFTDNVRLLERLGDCDFLSREQTELLADAYRCYRSRIHRLSLSDDEAVVAPDEELAGYRDAVAAIWEQRMKAPAD